MGNKSSNLKPFLEKFAGLMGKVKGVVAGTALVGGAGLYGLNKITKDPDLEMRDRKYARTPQVSQQ